MVVSFFSSPSPLGWKRLFGLWVQSVLHALDGTSDAFLHGDYRIVQIVNPSVHPSLHRVADSVNLLGGINLGDVGDEVQDTAGVAPLVVVPGNELHEALADGNAGLGVEDGRLVRAGEVGRDDGLVGEAEDALERALGGLLDGRDDLVVRRLLLEADDEVDDGDVEGRDTEGEATTKDFRGR